MSNYNVMPTYRISHTDNNCYDTFTITIKAKDFRGFLDHPTPDACNYLAEWLVGYMLDYEGIDDAVRGYGIDSLEEYEENVKIERLYSSFKMAYDLLYRCDENDQRLSDRSRAMRDGNKAIDDDNPWVRRLARRRCDLFVSDREVAALGYALRWQGLLDDKED